MQWFCRARKLCIILVKSYAAIMVKVTFDIKIFGLNKVKNVLLAARVTFLAMRVIGSEQFFKLSPKPIT